MKPFSPSAIAGRQQSLVARLQQLPPRGARPLVVARRVAGWATARACGYLAGLPGVRLAPEAVHVQAVPGRQLSLGEVLAQLARRLAETGCLPAWRNECLDVFGEGERLGEMERAAMRPLGLLTRAVHLNAWSPDGRMWAARRAPDKATDPDMWDTLVGGLVGAGESPEFALLRESHEEAGLLPEELDSRGPLQTLVRMHRRVRQGYQVEDVLLADCLLDAGVRPRNQDGEVSEIRLLAPELLWDMLEQGCFTLEAELCILASLAARCAPVPH